MLLYLGTNSAMETQPAPDLQDTSPGSTHTVSSCGRPRSSYCTLLSWQAWSSTRSFSCTRFIRRHLEYPSQKKSLSNWHQIPEGSQLLTVTINGYSNQGNAEKVESFFSIMEMYHEYTLGFFFPQSRHTILLRRRSKPVRLSLGGCFRVPVILVVLKQDRS